MALSTRVGLSSWLSSWLFLCLYLSQQSCARQAKLSPSEPATERPSSLKPTSLSARLELLDASASPCLLHLLRQLQVQTLSLDSGGSASTELTGCSEALSSLKTGPLILWAHERLAVGGAWADSPKASHELELIGWDLSPSSLPNELGEPLEGRWLRWARGGLERGSLSEPLPRRALSYLRLKRPAKPSAEKGGWWAHLGLWLPLDHLGYELSFTHPQGWPIGSFGPPPHLERVHASLKERRWWVPPARGGQGRVLYLSLTPSWRQLTRWAWTQLTGPLRARALDGRLQEGAQAAQRGVRALNAWLQRKVRYHYSPLRRYQPRPPLQTLRAGYGDCKDLSALAHVLLKAAGRPSWFALSSQRPLLSSARAIPSMGWFDHVLLWTPSSEERAALERSLADGRRGQGDDRLYSAPLSSWFDATGRDGHPAELSGRWAYVLLSAERGVWLQIGGLPISGASPKPQ